MIDNKLKDWPHATVANKNKNNEGIVTNEKRERNKLYLGNHGFS